MNLNNNLKNQVIFKLYTSVFNVTLNATVNKLWSLSYLKLIIFSGDILEPMLTISFCVKRGSKICFFLNLNQRLIESDLK